MAHWLDKVVALLQAETADLRELAIIAGGNPKTFYRGASLDDVDLSDQDVRGMNLSLDLNRVTLNARTKLDQSVLVLEEPRLPLLRLELVFTVDEPVELPAFRGNFWRGVFGPALKWIDQGIVPDLSTGNIAAGSLYRTFFDSAPPPDAAKMRLYQAIPHPYVLDAPTAAPVTRLKTGDQERIALTLVGRAATAVEAVLGAFDLAARSGLGRGREGKRGSARLTQTFAVWRDEAPNAAVSVFEELGGYRPVSAQVPSIPPCPPLVRAILATPLRLVQNGRTVGPRQFQPGMLISTLVRRVSMMSEFFGDTPLNTDFRALKEMWEGLTHEPQLIFAELRRWSQREKRLLKMDGLLGSFVLDMRDAEALFPYLWLGQWLNAGKGAVMGLGAIRIQSW